MLTNLDFFPVKVSLISTEAEIQFRYSRVHCFMAGQHNRPNVPPSEIKV